MLKVENPYPLWLDDDTRHLRKHTPDLLYPGFPLLSTKISFGGYRIFRHNTVNGLYLRRSSYLATLRVCANALSLIVLGHLLREERIESLQNLIQRRVVIVVFPD